MNAMSRRRKVSLFIFASALILVDIGIVKSVRKENKVYYKVDKSEIEKLLNRVKDLLI